ncbi:DUF4177 domain-containing protein [uncultured Jatrophihabitans sp.]|uniref:DUF4177 domain-containing protein n=1 Tax=uncultured Jatrophihabitans sp. TaxID=1610747 RepID=UPI0035CC5909
MADQWQYKVATYKLKFKGFDYTEIERDLNEHGSQGWEMLSTIAPSFGAGQAVEIAVVLKRPT